MGADASGIPCREGSAAAEAAYHLNLSERQVRHAVDQGKYDHALTHTREGRRALRFGAPARRWPLYLPVPDRRIVLLMKEDACAPGQRRRLGYTRL